MPILRFGWDPLNEEWLIGFFINSMHKLLLDAFSNELVVHYRKIDGFPNLLTLFWVSEVFVPKKWF